MTANNTSYLEYALIIVGIVLVAVIWLLAQVLITLSRSILKKRQSEMALKSMMIILFTSALSSVANAQDNYIVTGLGKDTNYGGMAALDFFSLSAVIGIELLVILLIPKKDVIKLKC
jgi:hypothetical protein